MANLLVVVVLCGIIACLAYPNPFTGLSYFIWPRLEKGPLGQNGIVQLCYNTSSGKYPGIIDLNIQVTNEAGKTHEFVILAVIGSQALRVWYGPGYFRDYLSPATNVQGIPDPWYNNAFISTGSLGPGQTYQITRKIDIPNNPNVRDALVEVCDIQNASNTFAWEVKQNIIEW